VGKGDRQKNVELGGESSDKKKKGGSILQKESRFNKDDYGTITGAEWGGYSRKKECQKDVLTEQGEWKKKSFSGGHTALQGELEEGLEKRFW